MQWFVFLYTYFASLQYGSRTIQKLGNYERLYANEMSHIICKARTKLNHLFETIYHYKSIINQHKLHSDNDLFEQNSKIKICIQNLYFNINRTEPKNSKRIAEKKKKINAFD